MAAPDYRELEIKNTADQNSLYPKNISFFFRTALTDTFQQAVARFQSAQTLNLVRALPTPETGYEWRIAQTGGQATLGYVVRNRSSNPAERGVSVYWNGTAGLSLRTRLIATGENTAPLPDGSNRQYANLVYSANGYTRPPLIDDTRKTAYASLHVGVPNGTYTLQVINTASPNTPLFSEALVMTDTGPETILLAPTQANQPPTVAKPVVDRSFVVGATVNFPLPDGTFVDVDGTVSSVAATGLPPGVAFNTSTLTFTGQPSQAGTYVVKLTATDDDGATVSDEFVITITAETITVPVKAETGTGTGSANGNIIDLPDGGKAVGDFGTANAQWTYPINVPSAGTYPVSITYATGDGYPSVCKVIAGTIPEQTVNLPNSGGWLVFKTITAQLQLPAGSSTLTFKGVNDQYWRLKEFSVPTSATTPTTPADPTAFVDYNIAQQRYLYWNPFLKGDGFNPTTLVFNTDEFHATQVFKDAGANAFGPAVFSHDLEPTTPGTYDFSVIDAIGKRSKELSQPFLLRVLLHRSMSYPGLDAIIPMSERQCDQTGVVGTYQNQVAASFASTSVRAIHTNMVNALIDHIASKDYAYLFMAIAFTTSPYYEGEYSQNTTNFDTFGLFDYSAPMQTLWRSRMQTKYGTLSALNTAHGTSYNTSGNWSQVVMPVPSNSGGYYWSFNSTSGRDLYDFRLDVLADWHNHFGSVVKAKSSKIKVICEVGSQHDPISLVRGTTGLVTRINPAYVDVMKQNADPAYDSRKQTEIGLAGGTFKAADEFCTGLFNFGTGQWVASIEANVNQATNSFRTGCSLMSVANALKPGSQYGNADWNTSVDRINNTLAQIFAQTPLSQPVPTKTYDPAKNVTMSLKAAVNGGGIWNTPAWSGWQPGGNFLLTDDL